MKTSTSKKPWQLGTVVGLLLILSGCQRHASENPNDLPVSYWADPKSVANDKLGQADACSLASAQAILKSGLLYPNYGTKDELAADGKTINKRITTTDFWLGGVRFVFPAEIAIEGGFPLHNPNNGNKLGGSLPNFYPKGPPVPVKDGMGAMGEVTFGCMMDLKDPTRHSIASAA